MRRKLVVVFITLSGTVAVASAALATAALAGAQPAALASAQPAATLAGARPAAEGPAAQLRANQEAARRDARERVHSLRLPPSDLTSSGPVPAFAKSFETSSSPPGTYYQSAERWELTNRSAAAIIAYVRSHPPAGSTLDSGSGSSSDTKTGVSSIDVQFHWPDVARQLLNRTLTVTVVTPRHGHSVVILQSEAAWFVPRPLSERVPAGVHAVAITLRLGPPATGPVVKPGTHVQTTRRIIWRPARVRQLIDTFDGLVTVQPAVEPLGCPMILTGSPASDLTLDFESGRGGATLARAQIFIHRGPHGADGAEPCNPIDFWIGSRPQTPLLSDTFVAQVGGLLGARIS